MIGMEHLVASFLNTSLDTPDPLDGPLGAARWWTTITRALPESRLVNHSKTRFTTELAGELRGLRSQLIGVVAGSGAAYRLAGLPYADGVLFPLLQAAAALFERAGSSRIKRCAGQSCGRYFLDETKNGSKRWCGLRCMERARTPRRRRLQE